MSTHANPFDAFDRLCSAAPYEPFDERALPPIFADFVATYGHAVAVNVMGEIAATDRLAPALLIQLWNGRYFTDLLGLCRSLIMKQIANGGPFPGAIADWCLNIHIGLARPADALDWAEQLSPLFRSACPSAFARLLIANGRLDEAAELAESVADRDFRCQFLLGWIAVKRGDREKGDHWRAHIVRNDEARIRTAFDQFDEAPQGSRANHAIPLPERLPFLLLHADVANPELIAEGARRLRQALAEGQAQIPAGICFAPPDADIADFTRLDAAAKQLLYKRGLNVVALEVMAIDNPWMEALGADDALSLTLASAMTPVSNEDFFYGFFGDRIPVTPGRSIAVYQAIDRDRKISLLSPYDGKRLTSDESYTTGGLIAYRFGEDQEFYLCTQGWQFRRAFLWWPQEDRIVQLSPLLGLGSARGAISVLKRLLTHTDLVARYRSQPRTLTIITGLNDNIGHNFHNEVSGLYRLAVDDLIPQDALIAKGPYDYYGFAERTARKVGCALIDATDLVQFTTDALNDGRFIVHATDVAAYRGQCEELRQTALTVAPSQRCADIEESIASADYVALFTLRTKRRIWRGQDFGIAQLVPRIRKVVREYGKRRVLVMFDGYTKTGLDEGEEVAIERERALVDTLIARAPTMFAGVEIANCIGLTLWEKARLFPHVDVAVCPKGNGHLPTLAWIANVPTVVHSNSSDLGGVVNEVAMREDGKLVGYLDANSITDRLKLRPLATLSQNEITHSDYDLNAEHLALEVERVVRLGLSTGREVDQ